MSAFFRVFKREWNKLKAERYILFSILLVPVLASLVIFLIFSAGTAHKLPIAVLDNDNTDFSRKLVRFIGATPACNITHTLENPASGLDLIKKGDIYAFIVIPENFKHDLITQKRPHIAYYYNNQTLLIGGIINKDIKTALVTAVKGADVAKRMKTGLSEDNAMLKINPVKIDEKVKANPYLNYSYFISFAAFAHIIQVFILLCAIWSLGYEFKEGTTKDWLDAAGNSIITGVFGKFSLYAVYFLVLTAFIYGTYIISYGVPFEGNFAFFMFASLFYILAYQMAGLIIVTILANLRFSMSAGAFFASLGLTISGMTYPIIAMPLPLRIFSGMIPVRPYVALLVDQALRGFPVKYDFIYVLWLFCFALVAIFFLPLLKHKAQDEELWYGI